MEDRSDQASMHQEPETREHTTLETDNSRLRATLLVLLEEKQRWISQLAGIKGLVRQLQGKREEIKSLTEKLERTQETLARAEHRIAQLCHALAGNGVSPQEASNVVLPGTSKKVLEALTAENTNLRSTLENLLNRYGDGVDLAVENGHLHETIMTLRDERDAKTKEVEELKRLLTAIEKDDTDALKEQTARLTEKVTKLGRQLNAKQAFCEVIATENETLKEKLSSYERGKIDDCKDEGDSDGEDCHEALEEGDAAEWTRELEEATRERDRLRDELAKMSDTAHQCARLKGSNEKLSEELGETREERDLLRQEMEKVKTASAENANVVENLRRKVTDLQQFIAQTAKERNDFQASLEELRSEFKMAQTALVSYETDFKKEREEKKKAERDLQTAKREREHLVGECNRFQKNYLDLHHWIQQNFSSTTGQNVFRPREDLREFAVPAPKSTVPASNKLQCPTCKRMFHCDLLEGHMRNCND